MIDSELLSGTLFFIVLATIGIVAIVLTRQDREATGFEVSSFVIAFVLRFSMALWIYEFGLVEFLGDEDASGWVRSVGLKQDWDRFQLGPIGLASVLVEPLLAGNDGYMYMLALVFYGWNISPEFRLVAAVFNCFLGAATVVVVHRVAALLFSRDVARTTTWFMIVFPSFVIWSAQTIKEPIILLLEAVAVYAVVAMRIAGFSVGHLAALVGSIVVVAAFRVYASYILAGVALLSFVLPSIRNVARTIPLIGVAAAVVVAIAIFGLPEAHETAITGRLQVAYIDRFRSWAATATGSGTDFALDLRSPWQMPIAVVLGFAHLLFAPFPWQWAGGSGRLLAVIPELLVWWWMFFYALIPGLRHALRTRFFDVQPLLFFIIGFGVLYGMFSGNAGLAYRQRTQLLPWLFIFAAVGFEQRRLTRAARREAMLAANVASAR